MERTGKALLILAAMAGAAGRAEEVEEHPVFDWDLVSLEQNSHRYNGSVLSGFHNLRSPGVTPHRAWKTGLGLIYSQENQVATAAGVDSSFSTQRLIMNPKINYGFYDALEAGVGLEANYVVGQEVTETASGPIENSEENADFSAAVAGLKWSFPRWWQKLRLGAAFDTRVAVNRHEFGMLSPSLFNFEIDGEYTVTSRFSFLGNLQFMTSDSFKVISDQVIGDVGATYTFSDEFRGLVFGTLAEDDPAQAVIIFLGFAGQYLYERHSFVLAVDFQVNDVRRDVQTQGQIDVEFSYTFTFR